MCTLYTVLIVCNSDGISFKYTGMKSFCGDQSKLDPGVSVVKRGTYVCVHVFVSWVRIPPEQLFFLFGEKRVVWVSCLALFSIYRS